MDDDAKNDEHSLSARLWFDRDRDFLQDLAGRHGPKALDTLADAVAGPYADRFAVRSLNVRIPDHVGQWAENYNTEDPTEARFAALEQRIAQAEATVDRCLKVMRHNLALYEQVSGGLPGAGSLGTVVNDPNAPRR